MDSFAIPSPKYIFIKDNFALKTIMKAIVDDKNI